MAGGSSNNAKPAKGTTEKKKRKRPSKKVPTTVVEASSNNFMNLVQKLTGSADELNYHTGGSSAVARQSTSPSPYPSPYSSPSNHTSQHDQVDHGPSSYHQQAAQYPHTTMDDDSGSSHNYSAYNAPTPYSTGGSSYSHHNPGSEDHHHYPVSSYGYPGSNYGSDHHVGGAAVNYDVGGGSGSTPRELGRGDEYRQAPGDDDLYEGLYSRSSYYNSNDQSTSDHHVDDEYDPASSRANYMEDDISPFSWRDPMNHNSTSDYWYHVDPMRAF